MIVCANCGTENPLGRVFCGGCGSKLDTSSMGKANVAGSQRDNFFVRHWGWLAAAVALIPVTLVVMSFMPAGKPIGAAGTMPGAKRVLAGFETLSQTPSGQSRGITLTEAEVNGYLDHFKRKALAVDSLSAVVQPEWIRFRIVDRLFSLNMGALRWAPVVTYDFDCIPVGGQLRVRKVTKGKLALSGPFRNSAVRKYLPKLRAQPDWDVLTSLSEIDAQEGQLHLIVEK